MRIALVSNCASYVPHPTGYGVSVTLWGILTGLMEHGHNVDVYSLVRDRDEIPDGHLTHLQNFGIKSVVISPASAADPSVLSSAMQEVGLPDLILCYTVGALCMVQHPELAYIPTVCITVDLDHLLPLYRRQYQCRGIPISYPEMTQLHRQAQEIKDAHLPLLRSCAKVISYASHHSRWLTQMGVNSTYLPMPVSDSFYPGWYRTLGSLPENDKPRIALAGHLRGIATMSGLYFLVEEVLPHLDLDRYEFRICGSDELDPGLATRFRPYPQVQFLGYVPDIQREIMESDLFLCPTPIELGFRTRLAEVMSLSGCIVAHSANQLGMPELEDGINCYLSSSGWDMASLIRELSKEREREVRWRMGRNARLTYEENFLPSVTVGKLVAELETTSGGN